MNNEASIGRAYNVGGTVHQFSTFVRAVASASGRKPLIASLPMPFGLAVDNTKAEREIGFRSRPLNEALAAIMAEETAGKAA